jgi:hydroxypyruvate isomerase
MDMNFHDADANAVPPVSDGLRYLANCSILFPDVPLLERPAAARAAGFDAVEFWWPFPSATPSDAEVDRFVTAVEDAGVQLVGLNFAAGDMPAGDRGLASWPGREREFLDSVDVAVGIAGRLGTVAFNALYGNRVDGHFPEEQDELAVRTLAAAAEAAATVGATVLLEPVSGAKRYPLLTAQDVVDVINRVERETGRTGLRLLADLYHLSVNGDDVAAALTRHHALVGHVQLADAPGRHEPGTGELPLTAHLTQLASAGYRGWVGLEYVPTSTFEAGLGWLPAELRSSRTAAAGS